MIGIVIVSHSAKLAEGVCELAAQMAQGQVRLAAAGGTDDPQNPIGTDAFKVQRAIESVYSDDGVLVLMDLGSAVLSAETALEFLSDDRRAKVRLCAAPLVEGAVAAVGQALADADLDRIAHEAQTALSAKLAHLRSPTLIPGPASRPYEGPFARSTSQLLAEERSVERQLTVRNKLGLHARPAVQLVRTAGRFQAHVTLRNVTEQLGPAEATSINGVLSLDVRQGHQLTLRASGPEAREALDALVALIESGFGEDEEAVEAAVKPPTPSAQPVEGEHLKRVSGELHGLPASPGIAIGPLARLRPAVMQVADQSADDPQAEWQRLQSAIHNAQAEIRSLHEWARAQVGDKEAAIFDAHLLFLDDPVLVENTSRRILDGHSSAESAWQATISELEQNLRGLKDAYLQARAADVMDVGQRVLRRLVGAATTALDWPRPVILAAHDLTPSDVHGLDPNRVLGLCLETGSATAHSIILARAMGLPAVVGLGPGISRLANDTVVALDGQAGIVWVEPDASKINALEQQRKAWQADRKAARAASHQPAITRDGRRVRVVANIGGVADARQALDCGAEGVGILRTEFLFLNRTTAPTEEEQLTAYRSIAEVLGPRPLVIRTLDIGGDKPLAYVEVGTESNPFLGWRGLRVSLAQPDLFKTQLRAILRASPGHPPEGDVPHIEIIFPMVSALTEVRAAKAILRQVQSELRQAGIPFDENVKVGIMIEVPAAVAVADQLAAEVDFFSIGSNDLSQYVMAADRTNARVAELADSFQPAVLRMIHQTVQAAKSAGIEVALCGELAGDPLAASMLVGMGLDELSMNATAIPDIKQAITRLTLSEVEAVAREVLALDSSEAIRGYLSQSFAVAHGG